MLEGQSEAAATSRTGGNQGGLMKKVSVEQVQIVLCPVSTLMARSVGAYVL